MISSVNSWDDGRRISISAVELSPAAMINCGVEGDRDTDAAYLSRAVPSCHDDLRHACSLALSWNSSCLRVACRRHNETLGTVAQDVNSPPVNVDRELRRAYVHHA